MIASCLIRTLAVIPAVLFDSQATRSLAMIIVIFTSPIVGAAMGTARLLAVPREVIGTVSGASGLLATCAQPLAPLAAGILLETVSRSTTFTVLGACFIAMALAMALPPSLRVRACR
jgi:sugar phosphate permease